jgi:hypothetical protein
VVVIPKSLSALAAECTSSGNQLSRPISEIKGVLDGNVHVFVEGQDDLILSNANVSEQQANKE